MKLNYRLQTRHSSVPTAPVLFIHGLFGSLDNLGVLARDLRQHHTVLQIDLRNHGLSFHSSEMNYPAMAQDVLTLLDQLHIEKAIIIGHSMGGKVAMALTAIAPQRIDKLVSIDIAPVRYPIGRHDKIFDALNAVTQAGVTQRLQAAQLMRNHIKEENVIQFLLKSFQGGEWRFNLSVLSEQYENIAGWQQVPAWQGSILFIKGELSAYIQDHYQDDIAHQFPLARVQTIAGGSHWVHAEKSAAVLRALHCFLNNTSLFHDQ